MQRLLFAIALFALVPSLLGAQPLERLPLPPGILATLPPPPGCCVTEEIPAEPSYQSVMASCLKSDKAAVVFVGHEGRKTPSNLLSCRVDALEGYPAKCVVICSPDPRGFMAWRATLPAGATDEKIAAAIGGRETSRSASFFEKRPTAQREEPEDGDSSLPTFLQELEPYTAATRTQLSFRRQTGWLGSTPRSVLERKWLVPGGLENAHGWSSRVFKSKNSTPNVALVRSDAYDSVSAIVWGRAYQDGTVFADVLRNDKGTVFEVRVAEKNDGHWDRFVAYKNISARPNGFVPMTSRQCAGCHDQAGASVYGGASIPGGDTIISDPLPIVESGQSVQNGNGKRL